MIVSQISLNTFKADHVCVFLNLARFNPSTAGRAFGGGHTSDGPGLGGLLPACAASATLQAQDGDTIAVVGAGGNVPCQEHPRTAHGEARVIVIRR